MARFPKGTRVRYSAEGRRTVGRRNPNRIGTVCTNSKDDELVTVHWDGHVQDTSNRYSVTFIEPLYPSPQDDFSEANDPLCQSDAGGE